MLFTVTVISTFIAEKPAGKDWELTGKDDPKYAYTPEITKRREVEYKVYEQTVKQIDIKAVIDAVNKMDNE